MPQTRVSIVVVIILAAFAAAQETRIQTFSAEQAISGDTDLKILLDAEVTITGRAKLHYMNCVT